MHSNLIVGVAFMAASAFGQQTGTGTLKEVLEQQQAAWNRGDLEGFMQTYSKSGDLTFFSGDTIIRGWQPTLDRYRKKYQAKGAQMGKLSFTEMQVTMLGRDGAMVTARWHLAMTDGKKREGLTTVICVHSARGWKIIHDHSS